MVGSSKERINGQLLMFPVICPCFYFWSAAISFMFLSCQNKMKEGSLHCRLSHINCAMVQLGIRVCEISFGLATAQSVQFCLPPHSPVTKLRLFCRVNSFIAPTTPPLPASQAEAWLRTNSALLIRYGVVPWQMFYSFGQC
jgi:hypothetical protein